MDDGFSGTNTAHRQGFQKLMKDAMDGKIDMGDHIDHLVRTDFDLGLTEREANRCIELLQRED